MDSLSNHFWILFSATDLRQSTDGVCRRSVIDRAYRLFLFAVFQLLIHHPHEPVGAGTAACISRQKAAWYLGIIRSRNFCGQYFLHGLALRNQFPNLCLHGKNHVAVWNDVRPVDEGTVAWD